MCEYKVTMICYIRVNRSVAAVQSYHRFLKATQVSVILHAVFLLLWINCFICWHFHNILLVLLVFTDQKTRVENLEKSRSLKVVGKSRENVLCL